MTIEVTNNPDPRFPGDWQVMDDGFCMDRYQTQEAAEEGAIKYRQQHDIATRVEELVDDVQEQIMAQFGLSSEDAIERMKEYIDVR